MQPRIHIAVPAFGWTMQSQTTASLVALTECLVSCGAFHSFSAHSFPDIVGVRNMFLTRFYDKLTDATHMLFVDADMQFEPDLVRDMLLADKPLVGCIYPKKRLPIEFVGSAFPDRPRPEPENGLIEFEGIGCGVMLIRRDCIDAMLEQNLCDIQEDKSKTALLDMVDTPKNRIIHAFDNIIDEDGRHLSEDYSFCHRHRKAGGKVYAAVDHVVCHIGQFQFASKYSDVYLNKSNEQQ